MLFRTLGLAAIGLVLGGIIYEHVGEWRDRKHFPQIGQSYDIGGRSLNMYCSGTGSPTVIFESNGNEPGFRWLEVQRQVATLTRACWYDRAGLGWSDPGPFPNHSEAIAHDLHNLLRAAKVLPPYIFVGYAMGAFHTRVFRSYFPDEVAGLVLVDPMNEDMTLRIHNHNELFRPTALLILRMLTDVGLVRLTQPNLGPPPQGWSREEWETLDGLYRLPQTRLAGAKELPIWVNGELARAGNCFGDLPMVVLSAGIQDQEEDPKLDHDHDWKLRLHERLAHLSTHGKHVVVPNSGHDIPDEAPDAIVAAIREILHPTRPVILPPSK
jgi:pimeloyl-ACP methyl ester carboxylesterase